MPFEIKYAIRNLLSRRGGLARLTGLAALSGVAFGVASLIVVQAIYMGFRTGIEENLVSQTAHITVTPTGNDIISSKIVVERFSRIPNVESVEPVIFQSSVITNGDEAAYGLLRIDLTDGSDGGGKQGVYLGKLLAERIDAKRGSEISVLVPDAAGGADHSALHVAGVIETGLYEYDSNLVRMGWSDYQTINPAAAEHPRSFLLMVRDPFEVEATAGQIKKAVGPGFSVSDWRTANRPLFTALSFERRVAALVLVLMIAISSLGIMSTLILLANERRFDMAVLKTCGARSRSLALIFLTEGIAIGLIGIAAGVAIGSLVCLLLNYSEFINLPGEVYSISKLTLIQDPLTAILISFGAFLLIFPSILVPVLKAARMKPAEILRRG